MINKSEIVALLKARGSEQQQLFALARRARFEARADLVVLRGVVEVASTCVKNCTYCPMRADNKTTRYIYKSDEIVDAAKKVHAAGLKVVSLQGGDTPRTTQTVGNAIPEIRSHFGTDVDILLVLGDKSREEYEHLKEMGATSYILKHETSDHRLHQLHRHSDLEDRIRCLEDLLDLGFKVGTGTIVGLPGQKIESIADDILLAHSLGTHMCSASPFIPALDTPLSNCPAGDIDLTLNTIALIRLMLPHAQIPSVSALEKRKLGGQIDGLNAGANVITVNFTPVEKQSLYPIYGRDRFIVHLEHALDVANQAGLKADRNSSLSNKKEDHLTNAVLSKVDLI